MSRTDWQHRRIWLPIWRVHDTGAALIIWRRRRAGHRAAHDGSNNTSGRTYRSEERCCGAERLIIAVLLYLPFRRLDEALLILGTLPFAVTRGVSLLYLKGYNLSVATGVGFIALSGVATEFGVIMLLYLTHAITARQQAGLTVSGSILDEARREGAVLRVRLKAMTVAVIINGLLPIFWGHRTGSEVMSRIAAPMVGGMITAPLLSMFLIPAAYRLMRIRVRITRQ